MKFLKWFFLFLLVPLTVDAAVVHVQSTGASSVGSVASLSKAFVSNITASNTIVAGGTCQTADNCTSATMFSDTQTNTYLLGVGVVRPVGVYVISAAAGATTVTLTPTASDVLILGIAEFSGVKTTSPHDGSNSTNGVSTTATSGQITTTTTGLLLGVCYVDGSGGTTENGAWTLIYEDEDFGRGSIIYRIAATGTYEATWTVPDSDWRGAIFALKEQPVAGRRPSGVIIY